MVKKEFDKRLNPQLALAYSPEKPKCALETLENGMLRPDRAQEEWLKILKDEGYRNIALINNKYCALDVRPYSINIIYDIDDYGYERRYTYGDFKAAYKALDAWVKAERPTFHPTGWNRVSGEISGYAFVGTPEELERWEKTKFPN